MEIPRIYSVSGLRQFPRKLVKTQCMKGAILSHESKVLAVTPFNSHELITVDKSMVESSQPGLFGGFGLFSKLVVLSWSFEIY